MFLSLQTITTADEAKAFEGEGDAVVIGLFASADSDAAKAFMSAAAGIDRLPFAIATTPAVRFDGPENRSKSTSKYIPASCV